MARQDGNILGVFAERRHVERDHVQAVEKIFAESSGGDLVFEFLVRSGDDADIDVDRLVRAHRLEALFLENTQHFGLRAQAHVADFVEEKRAPIRLLEFSHFVLAGAGEAALGVPEELGLDQLLGNGGAIHFDERLSAAQARGVQRAGHQFFSRSAFSVNQDASVGGSGERDLLAQSPDRHAVPVQLRASAKLFSEAAVFQFQPVNFEGIHPIEPHVEENQIWGPLIETRKTLFAGRYRRGLIPFVSEDRRKRLADALLVVHNEDGMRHGFPFQAVRGEIGAAATSVMGSCRMNLAPMGELSSTRMDPWCSAMMRLAMARPSPVPRSFVEKWGRKSLSLSSGEIPWPLSPTIISMVS